MRARGTPADDRLKAMVCEHELQILKTLLERNVAP